jgi:isopentenyl diphosphate isomerase/L-lactate dehydrogenase-like FMN-dependent dehydrogenase
MNMVFKALFSPIMEDVHKTRMFYLGRSNGVSVLTFHRAQSPLLTLLEIKKFAPHLIGSKMQIFIDGGIRRGTDVLKALALGATAVGLGRPFLFSMSAGYGEKGVLRMLDILRQEIETNMVFLGATSLKELRPEMLNVSRLERDLVGSVKL